MKQYLKNELDKLERGIVATPTDEYLNEFTKANNGSNDFLLMQMAKNFGYKLALLNMEDALYYEIDKPLVKLALQRLLEQVREDGKPFEEVNKIIKQIDKIDTL
tara:strand:+ start:407 stop:718 length:312 start_codon:yes stop_codon:yes gene_type:complete